MAWPLEATAGDPLAVASVTTDAVSVGLGDKFCDEVPAASRLARREATPLLDVRFEPACRSDKERPSEDEDDAGCVVCPISEGEPALCLLAGLWLLPAVVSPRTFDQSDGSGVAGADAGVIGDSTAEDVPDKDIMIRSNLPKR